jgi:Co/Zn/Cd efflux system component
VASLYLWLKYLHLVGLAVFLLGHGVSAGTSLVLRRPLPDVLRGSLLQLSIRGNFASFPGLALLLITGVWMGFLGSWWHWGWIWTAIGVLVVVMVAMSAQSVPYHKAREAVGGSKPEGEIEIELKRARPVVMAVIGSVGLVTLIFLMVFKPF